MHENANKPALPARSARRFGLSDAMILVAATAAGLAATRALIDWDDWDDLMKQLDLAGIMVSGGPGHAGTADAILLDGAILASLSMPMAVAWTLGVLACGLRGPRPGRRRMMRRPGLVAGLAIVPTLATWGTLILGAWLRDGPFNVDLSFMVVPPMGMSVMAAWLPQIAGRCWRPEPTWADRLGRALGAYWIISGLLILSHFVLGRA